MTATIDGEVMESTDLALRNSQDMAIQMSMPVLPMAKAIERRNAMVAFVKEIMVEGTDFGKVPGTDKPTLLKPGAEKLATFFGLTTRFELMEKVEDWTGDKHNGEAFFYYLYRCRMFRNGVAIAESDGSCNSWESKYRYRWVNESDLPPHLDAKRLLKRAGTLREPVFAIERRETGGKYGKPDSYWKAFEDAIAGGTAKRVEIPKRDGGGKMAGWEIPSVVYRIPNEDMPSQVNTIQKMSQKRALIGATLLAVNASEYFTQDLEDLAPIETTPQQAAPEAAEFKYNSDGEADLTHLPTFLHEWDHVIRHRGIAVKIGRNFMATAFNKRGTSIEDSDEATRGEIIERLTKGEFDDILKGKKTNGQQGAAAPAQQAATQQPAAQPATEPPEHKTEVEQVFTPQQLEKHETFIELAQQIVKNENVAWGDALKGFDKAAKRLGKKLYEVSAARRAEWLNLINARKWNWLEGVEMSA